MPRWGNQSRGNANQWDDNARREGIPVDTDPRPGDVERHLERTARDLGAPGRDRYYGWGLVDAAAATKQRVTPSG